MKPGCFAFFFAIIPGIMLAQENVPATDEPPTNSFKKIFEKSNPSLQYSYNEKRQVHDYSGNWDLDGDKKPDSVYFVGNGGAHLYFHLVIVLSTDPERKDFPFLVTDWPLLEPVDKLKKEGGRFVPASFPKFVVHDFDKDSLPEIYLNTDTSFAPVPAIWKKRGVTSQHVLIDYSKKILLKNFSPL